MKKLTKYALLLAALVMGFAFTSCQQDSGDDTTYYTVSFNSNGGTEVTSQKVESGKKATKPANPTKQAIATETYVFENWYTSTNNGTTISDTAFDFNTPITKDITLYAKWATNVVTHTVTFDSKNGSTAEIKTVNHGNKVERPTNPTKAATEAETYTFDNWYTSTDGGTTLSETAFDFDTEIEGDITLYAKWTATAIHTVTFNTKGGSTSPAEQTIVHGNKATKPADPTKQATETETYTFENWYTSEDEGTTLSDTAFDFDTAITKDITLYAKWATNVVTHTVTFDSKNGSTAETKTVNHGNKVERPADPTKEGSAFKGWFVGDTEFDFTTPITGTLEITAKWFAGTKKPDAQKAVGDIVFADGSATPYTSGLTLTDEQKENSIAIIYKADVSKAYGVGILQNKDGLLLYNRLSKIVIKAGMGEQYEVKSIMCDFDSKTETFTGDTDGSDNLAEIKAFLEENDKTEDDTDDLTHYPAFEFAINYKDKEGSHVKNTDFEDGWYLPSLAELYDIWTQKSTVNEACKLCTGKSLEDDAMAVDDEYEAAYLSSTPSSINNGQYIIFKEDNMKDALLPLYVCNFPGNVCCIRVFN